MHVCLLTKDLHFQNHNDNSYINISITNITTGNTKKVLFYKLYII